MNIKYNIGQELFCIIDKQLKTCKVLECIISSNGISYNIELDGKTIALNESELIDSISDLDSFEKTFFYVRPILEESIEKTSRGFSTYKSSYKQCKVYKITEAKIGILREENDEHPSFIDFTKEEIGTIETSKLLTFGIKTPRVTDTEWGKLDKNDEVKFIIDFNNLVESTDILKLIKPAKDSVKSGEARILYSNILDKIILNINPNIKKTFKPIEKKVCFLNLTVVGDYAYNDEYVITHCDTPKPEKIKYGHLGEIGVDLEHIQDFIFEDTDVLPSYKIYKILTFNNISVESIINYTNNAQLELLDDVIEFLNKHSFGILPQYLNRLDNKVAIKLSALIDAVQPKNQKTGSNPLNI